LKSFMQTIQAPPFSFVHPKLILAAAVSPGSRSAPVPGRSNVAKQAGIGLAKARRRSCIAVAGDGHTPPLAERENRSPPLRDFAPWRLCVKSVCPGRPSKTDLSLDSRVVVLA
jgi:hypothetical protein